MGNLQGEKRPKSEWLDKVILYDFGNGNVWTVNDAVEGTQIFGGTGSGKTSGSGRSLAVPMLRLGMGGLVLASKSDDLDTWLGYFRAAKNDPTYDPREGDQNERKLIVVETGSEFTINPLDYEYSLAVGKARETASTRLVNTFLAALSGGGGSASNADPYWEDALRELLSHATDLISFANGGFETGEFRRSEKAPRLQEIQDVVRSAPQNLEEVKGKSFQESSGACARYLRKADAMYSDKRFDGASEIGGDLRDTFDYWTRSFPSLAERTRSVVVSSFTAKASGLLRAPLRSLFCGDSHPEATPQATYDGKVVLLNLPVKSFGDVGEFAQKLVKTVWQHATESEVRDVNKPCLPVFLWADESQHFVTSEDVLYQATARSKLAATVYLTQNIANYYVQLGGMSSSATDALLGSLQMKVFHANGDPATNDWAERLIGTADIAANMGNRSLGHDGKMQLGSSKNIRTQRLVPAWKFTKLNRGTGAKGTAGAYIFHAGKPWNNAGHNFKEHSF